MKTKSVLLTLALGLALSFGFFSLSAADGESGDGTYTTQACHYTDSNGNVIIGAQCMPPAYKGPCAYATPCA